MDQFLEENLAKGFIPSSKSLRTFLVFFISKKDGGKHIVTDYKYLNQGTVKNNYLLPLILQLVDCIKGCTLFTKMDLRWGYNNIWICAGNKCNGIVITAEGSFEPNEMFF